MAEIIQPEGVDMFHMDLEHIHAVLRNRSYNMESLMMRVGAAHARPVHMGSVCSRCTVDAMLCVAS
jgi:hypothetical protein